MAHSHEHHHDHSHAVGSGHRHGPTTYDRAFAIGILLNIGIVLAELGFGYVAHSLALVADAAHNLSDVGSSFGLGSGVAIPSQPDRATNIRLPSGLGSGRIGQCRTAAVATGGIVVEALRRFAEPQQLEPGTVIWVAALAIVLNGIVALMFMRGRRDDLNIRGAFLQMLGDAEIDRSHVGRINFRMTVP